MSSVSSDLSVNILYNFFFFCEMELIIGLFILSILLIFTYFLTKRYDSLDGLLIILFGFLLIGLKFLTVGSQTLIFVRKTFWISGLYVSIITVFGIIIILLMKNIRKGLDYNFRYLIFLLLLYIFFGYLQQILFQFVFTETVFFLTNNIKISVVIGAFYYFLFHLRSFKRPEFLFGTFLLGLMWSSSYIIFGNLFWLGISHGIIGTIYYLNLWEVDVLRKRLQFINRFL